MDAETEKIRNQNLHEYIVKEEEYEFLCELHDWLIRTFRFLRSIDRSQRMLKAQR